MRNWILNFKKNKKELYFKFLDYQRYVSRGSNWISFFETYVPFHKILDYAVALFGVSIVVNRKSVWWIVIGGIAYLFFQILMELLKWLIARYDYKKAIWKYEIEWSQKNEKYNPAYWELRRTLESICAKTGAKSYYKDL